MDKEKQCKEHLYNPIAYFKDEEMGEIWLLVQCSECKNVKPLWNNSNFGNLSYE